MHANHQLDIIDWATKAECMLHQACTESATIECDSIMSSAGCIVMSLFIIDALGCMLSALGHNAKQVACDVMLRAH